MIGPVLDDGRDEEEDVARDAEIDGAASALPLDLQTGAEHLWLVGVAHGGVALGDEVEADVGAVLHVWDCVLDAVGAVGRARAGELIGQARQRHAHADRGRARAADVGLEGDSFRRRDAEAASPLTPAAKR